MSDPEKPTEEKESKENGDVMTDPERPVEENVSKENGGVMNEFERQIEENASKENGGVTSDPEITTEEKEPKENRGVMSELESAIEDNASKENGGVMTELETARESREPNGGLEVFHLDDLIRGRRLGQGAYADVYEVEQFRSKEPLQENGHSNFGEEQQALVNKEQRDDLDQEGSYAVKCLRNYFDNPKKFRIGAQDLETEADLLSTLDHPHIIKLYAKSASETKASDCTKEHARDFFIVLDRLSCNLTAKMDRWLLEKRKITDSSVLWFHDEIQERQLFVERLRVANAIALAIAYLHEEGIVYRDLKADNVGFDMEGKCKIFDFGLARRLPTDKKEADDTYVMSGMVGSLPHMAPEVWKKEPYNETVDVYSFAILMWSMLSLRLPYLELARDLKNLTNLVMIKGHRPPLYEAWPQEIHQLLRKAWSPDAKERPSMQQVSFTLMEIIASEEEELERQKLARDGTTMDWLIGFFVSFFIVVGTLQYVYSSVADKLSAPVFA